MSKSPYLTLYDGVKAPYPVFYDYAREHYGGAPDICGALVEAMEKDPYFPRGARLRPTLRGYLEEHGAAHNVLYAFDCMYAEFWIKCNHIFRVIKKHRGEAARRH